VGNSSQQALAAELCCNIVWQRKRRARLKKHMPSKLQVKLLELPCSERQRVSLALLLLCSPQSRQPSDCQACLKNAATAATFRLKQRPASQPDWPLKAVLTTSQAF